MPAGILEGNCECKWEGDRMTSEQKPEVTSASKRPEPPRVTREQAVEAIASFLHKRLYVDRRFAVNPETGQLVLTTLPEELL